VSRFEVDPSLLAGASAGHATLAGDLFGLGREVDGLAGAAAGAVGDPEAAGVLADCATAWSTSLTGLAEAVSGLGANLAAAADAYARVDAQAMPRR
jgi:hypothetical protein